MLSTTTVSFSVVQTPMIAIRSSTWSKSVKMMFSTESTLTQEFSSSSNPPTWRLLSLTAKEMWWLLLLSKIFHPEWEACRMRSTTTTGRNGSNRPIRLMSSPLWTPCGSATSLQVVPSPTSSRSTPIKRFSRLCTLRCQMSLVSSS